MWYPCCHRLRFSGVGIAERTGALVRRTCRASVAPCALCAIVRRVPKTPTAAGDRRQPAGIVGTPAGGGASRHDRLDRALHPGDVPDVAASCPLPRQSTRAGPGVSVALRTCAGPRCSGRPDAAHHRCRPASCNSHRCRPHLAVVPHRRRAMGVVVIAGLLLFSDADRGRRRSRPRSLATSSPSTRPSGPSLPRRGRLRRAPPPACRAASPNRLAVEATRLGMAPAQSGEFMTITPDVVASVAASASGLPASVGDQGPTSLDQFGEVKSCDQRAVPCHERTAATPTSGSLRHADAWQRRRRSPPPASPVRPRVAPRRAPPRALRPPPAGAAQPRSQHWAGGCSGASAFDGGQFAGHPQQRRLRRLLRTGPRSSLGQGHTDAAATTRARSCGARRVPAPGTPCAPRTAPLIASGRGLRSSSVGSCSAITMLQTARCQELHPGRHHQRTPKRTVLRCPDRTGRDSSIAHRRRARPPPFPHHPSSVIPTTLVARSGRARRLCSPSRCRLSAGQAVRALALAMSDKTNAGLSVCVDPAGRLTPTASP